MRGAWVLLGVLVAGCATTQRARPACGPLPAEYPQFPGAYPECAVDRKVRLISQPTRADFSRVQPLAVGSSGCYQAEHQFIVDEKGVPMLKTVRLVRTNSQSYADVMRESISGLKFEPARHGGMPVPQLYTFATKMRYTVSATAPSSRRPPPC